MKKSLIYLAAAFVLFSCTKTEIKEVEKIVEVPTEVALEQVSLTSSAMMTTEADAQTITITASIATSLESDAVINLNFAGSAELSSDYSVSSNSITINAGELSGSTDLTIISDGVFESGVENIIVSLAGLSNSVTPNGTNSLVQIDITDGAAMVGFSEAALTVEETSSYALDFTLSKALNEDIVVRFSTETANTGYGVSSDGIVIFAPGETSKTVFIDLNDFRITNAAQRSLNITIDTIENDDVMVSSTNSVAITTTEIDAGFLIDASWVTDSDLFELRLYNGDDRIMSSTRSGNTESIFIDKNAFTPLANGTYTIELDDFSFSDTSASEVVTFTFLDETGQTYGGPYTFTVNNPGDRIMVFTLEILDGVYTLTQNSTSN